ncbi:MAG: FHA domain-containing protein [Planctomycetes bacterium]|nr:FHA domain-containing protein [Planctomycetota bacterium]
MEAKLIVVGGDAKATEIKLKLPTIIGRGRGASLTLPHALVSRQHCEIYEAGGQLYVRDMGSLNGTFVGNEPISEAPLPPGELLTVGAVTFRAIYGELLEEEKRSRREDAVGKPGRGKAPTVRPTETVGNEVERTRRDAPFVPAQDEPTGDSRDAKAAPPLEKQEVPLKTPPRRQDQPTVRAPEKSPPMAPAAAPAAAAAEEDSEADTDVPKAGQVGKKPRSTAKPSSSDEVLDDADIDPKAPTDFPAALPTATEDGRTGKPDAESKSSDGKDAGDDELQAFLRSLK